MKKIIFVLAIAALVISVSSCGNKKQKAEVGTHSHEDGTVHKDDAHEHDAKPNQETFEVKADNDADHKHEGGDADKDGHQHDHGDGDSHDSDAEHKHAEGDTEGHDHDNEDGEHK